jgi:hypothetical protein
LIGLKYSQFNLKEASMGIKKSSMRFVCAVFALCLGMMACNVLSNTTRVGDVNTDTQSVDLGSASTARAQFEFAAGSLRVDGGADQLMEATFRTNVPAWQAQVNYNINGSQGELLVKQPTDNKLPVRGEVINDWNIRLNNAVPLDLVVNTGAGVINLNLSDLDLSTLQVETQAGTTSLDLSGNWDHDVTAAITGGVGELSITLPSEIGVRVNMDTALVSVTTTGLEKDGDGYVNQAYGTAPNTLTLDLQTGIGSVKLMVP